MTQRTVAIKTIRFEGSKAECVEFEARFYHETSAGRLRHANIVAIHDAGVTEDFAYVAMEYVEGESLREMLDSGVVLPIEMIASIVERVANALNFAHENHVVHRDIKPANILITRDRDVKIKDFGIAQIPTGLHTPHGTILGILGTPQYMAPEQVVGGNTDGRTDIFVLGVVLYEMLAGVTPFNGDNLSAIMGKVLKEDPVPPSTLNPRVPPAFDRINSRVLAKRPRDRHQTAFAFARDLRNPDAATPREAGGPAAGRKPAKDPDIALLPPTRTVRKGVAVRSSAKASPLGRARVRKPLLLALPIVIIAALVMVFQGLQPRSDQLSVAALAKPSVPAAPTVSATPAVPETPTVPVSPTVAALPVLPAKPKVTAKTRVTAMPKAPAMPGVPESKKRTAASCRGAGGSRHGVGNFALG